MSLWEEAIQEHSSHCYTSKPIIGINIVFIPSPCMNADPICDAKARVCASSAVDRGFESMLHWYLLVLC